MTVHMITLVKDRYNKPGEDRDGWEIRETEFLVENPYQSRQQLTRSHLHFHGPDEVKNIEQGWTTVPSQDPIAYFVPLPSVISAHYEKPLPTITVAIGDFLVDPAHDLIVKVVSGGSHADTKLEIISCRQATVDLTAKINERLAARAQG